MNGPELAVLNMLCVGPVHVESQLRGCATQCCRFRAPLPGSVRHLPGKQPELGHSTSMIGMGPANSRLPMSWKRLSYDCHFYGAGQRHTHGATLFALWSQSHRACRFMHSHQGSRATLALSPMWPCKSSLVKTAWQVTSSTTGHSKAAVYNSRQS